MAELGNCADVLKALDDYQVALAIKGDEYAFTLLYKRWHPKLLRLAYLLSRNKDEAQDIMQEAALTIAKNINKLENPEKFSSWAYTIIRRRVADHISSAVRVRDIQKRVLETDVKPYLSDVDASLSMKQALTSLPQSDRALLMLFYMDGMSGREIGAAMGIPLGTVKSRLFTARAKLHETYTVPKGD